MAVFEYTAKDTDGSIFTGTYNDINSVSALKQELTKLDYVLVKAHRKKIASPKKLKAKSAEVINFAYRFAGMCAAGLSIVRCLEVSEEQAQDPAFKYIISDIRQKVETGSSLTQAFEKYRDIFSDFYLGMLEAGESGSKLPTTLEMTGLYLENQANLKQKIKSAFAYPIVVGVMCVLIVTYLLIFVVPIFTKLYKQLKVNLPGPTQSLVYLSDMVRNWWPVVLFVGIGMVILFRKISKKSVIRKKWDIFKLKMPVLGKLNQMIVVSRFVRTFAMLASAGVSYVEAIKVAGKVTNNYRTNQITEQLTEKIKSGHSMTDSLGEYELFPPMIIQLTAAGEEAGVLPDMLNKGVDFLDKDIDRVLNALLVKLEPALTLVMGSIVGFILMGVYLPMFDYMSHLK